MKNITCFGEVLWDVFPNVEKIGGAPLNVATRLQSFTGNNVSIISSIGKDTRGTKIAEYLKKQHLNTDCLQVDNTLETGCVDVVLDKSGSATYDIKSPRAWDNIQLNQEVKTKVANSDAFVFGSLVARNSTSRNTLYELLKVANYKIFDANLRAPYYNTDLLSYLMNKADFIKLNDDELFEIAEELGSKTVSLEQNIVFIANKTKTNTICVTKGKYGAVLYINKKFYYNSGFRTKVVDTVGAGDSFLATLVSKLLNKEDPQLSVDYACAVGAIVASSEGANPSIEKETIERFLFYEF